MINTVIVGRLTSDPIIATRHIGDADVKVANFTVAASTGFGDRKKTSFFRIALWHGQADMAEKCLTKGRLVACKGSTGIRSYIGKNGTPQTVLEFGSDVQIEMVTANPNKGEEAEQTLDDDMMIVDDDEDLPF